MQINDVDSLLVSHIDSITKGEYQGIDVVLFLPGMVLGGQIASYQQYYEQLASSNKSTINYPDEELRELGTLTQEEDAKRMQRIRDYIDSFPEGHVLTDKDERFLNENHRRFIHLINVQVLSPGSDNRIVAPAWRGQLQHIIGWSYGLIPD